MAAPARGLLLVASALLLGPGLCGRAAHGARVPTAGSIAADLLVRAAGDCDVGAAWRILGRPTFQGEWLTKAGSAGETPLMAAMRAGCPELVGHFVLHPQFDRESIRREKQRRVMGLHAMQHGEDADEQAIIWALGVLIGIKKSWVLDVATGAWHLPQPGEWMPPATLSEMGVVLPLKPPFPEKSLEVLMPSDMFESFKVSSASTGESNVGFEVKPADVEMLWYLLVSRTQAADDERRADLDRHIRSFGWTLFFRGSKVAMSMHHFVIKYLAERLAIPDLLTEDEGKSGEMSVSHIRSLRKYRAMGADLHGLWEKLGTWRAA